MEHGGQRGTGRKIKTRPGEPGRVWRQQKLKFMEEYHGNEYDVGHSEYTYRNIKP
jgi:hypothetical protein